MEEKREEGEKCFSEDPSGILSSCRLCPRQCAVNRLLGQRGFCGASAELFVARAALHFWEEPCISGKEGSGAVFFTGCALRCVFCQNSAISRREGGRAFRPSELSELFLRLQEEGANNINLVSPDHEIPLLLPAMREARERGLRIPYVINCSGYECRSQLRLLKGLADIYLMDFKYMDPEKAQRYSAAFDYPKRAKESLREMTEQCGEAVFDSRGMMRRGVIVRHLLMPGMVRDGKAIVRYVHEHYGEKVYLSLMQQYTPVPGLSAYPEINRCVTKREYGRLLDYAISLGIEHAFIQEEGAAKESFIPDWDWL